jgi:hypothetical protein
VWRVSTDWPPAFSSLDPWLEVPPINDQAHYLSSSLECPLLNITIPKFTTIDQSRLGSKADVYDGIFNVYHDECERYSASRYPAPTGRRGH